MLWFSGRPALCDIRSTKVTSRYSGRISAARSGSISDKGTFQLNTPPSTSRAIIVTVIALLPEPRFQRSSMVAADSDPSASIPATA